MNQVPVTSVRRVETDGMRIFYREAVDTWSMGGRIVLEQRHSASKSTGPEGHMRTDPLTSLMDDIAVLQRSLERTTGPVVLVGHAYGGAVIAGPINVRVKSLMYVAALAPDEGETVADVFYRADPHPSAPHLAPDEHGVIWMPEEGFSHAVAHKVPQGQATILGAVQRPISVKCIQEQAPTPAWKTKPSWFLLAEEDRMISPQTQRYMADRMHATIRSHQVDHSPMLTAPDLVVELTLEAARGTLG